ncbi:hypothetical protein XENOCAPTIV_019301 [Xenoophorus captivus]|uniref:Glycoside hydrolase family 38 central domain-containing protein n=1 Tax=Xenoophorus captivus TaxID=1517983 RepID=A0ABV0QVX9_9TELE
MMPFYSYDVPHTCGPDPKICCQFDFKRLPGGRINCPWKVPPKSVVEANVAERAQLLLDQYRKKSKLYRSKVLLVPLGDDFRYDKALEWDQQYTNYQKLFDYMNSQPELHVQTVRTTTGRVITPLDPFTKAWTVGAEILYSLAVANARHAGMEGRYPVTDYALLVDARRSVGLFQHHDAITGTAKENVVIDYGTKYLVLFNPIEQERLCAVTVLVNTVRVRVLTEDGQTLPVQLSAQWGSATQMSAEVQMQFMIYGTRPSKDKSGAYLFLPDGKPKVFSWLYLTC